jgi:hypothetical protein
VIPDEALKQSERWHPERKSRDEAHCDERGDLFVGHGCSPMEAVAMDLEENV